MSTEQQDLQRCAQALKQGGARLLQRVFCAVLSDRGASLDEARAFGIMLRDDLQRKGLLPQRTMRDEMFGEGESTWTGMGGMWWFNDGQRWRRM